MGRREIGPGTLVRTRSKDHRIHMSRTPYLAGPAEIVILDPYIMPTDIMMVLALHQSKGMHGEKHQKRPIVALILLRGAVGWVELKRLKPVE